MDSESLPAEIERRCQQIARQRKEIRNPRRVSAPFGAQHVNLA